METVGLDIRVQRHRQLEFVFDDGGFHFENIRIQNDFRCRRNFGFLEVQSARQRRDGLREGGQIGVAKLWNGAKRLFDFQQLCPFLQKSHAGFEKMFFSLGEIRFRKPFQRRTLRIINRLHIQIEIIGLPGDVLHAKIKGDDVLRKRACGTVRFGNGERQFLPFGGWRGYGVDVDERFQIFRMLGDKAEHERQFVIESLGVAADFRFDDKIFQIEAIVVVVGSCRNRDSQEDRLVILRIRENDMLADECHAVFRQLLWRVLLDGGIKDAVAERNI